ncbi:MAG: nicotinate-nucleotide adenylyltransferase [Lachnospiraceae bacterium]|nr:nicotinate-nucleotide adenylyltransferase [Lachnospiraceae bacterium]
MRKIGILGGTFNPIHFAHINLALKAYEEYELDEVLFIPSGISYMKKDMDILDAKTRCELVSLAINDYPFFKLDTIEVDRAGNSYTFETLLKLNEREDAVYYYIVGADTLFMIEKWKEPKQVFDLSVLLVAVRDEYDKKAVLEKIAELENKYNARISIIHGMNALDISSTKIRDALKRGKSIDEYVPKKEGQYILERGLFQ